jgi:hypothetical protein
VIEEFRGMATRGDWTGAGAPLPVDGSYDGFRYEPMYKLDVPEEEVHGQLKMWFGDGVRTLRMTRGDKVEGPNGHVKNVYRFSVTGSGEEPAFDRYAADDAANTPPCMMTLRQDMSWAQQQMMDPIERNYLMPFDVFVTVPHLGICPQEIQELGPEGLSFDPAKHDSYVDLEPTSGLALNGAQRMGRFVRVKATPWYPNMASTSSSGFYYVPWFWGEETHSVSDNQE